MKKPSDLTTKELDDTLTSLIKFYDFSYFGERNISVSDGMIYALEFAACSLGLAEDWLYEGDYNSADMMKDFENALDSHAKVINNSAWARIKSEMNN